MQLQPDTSATDSGPECGTPSQDFLLGFLLLHHFHSIEAAVRECRLLLCYTEVKNTQEAFCYGIMD